MRVIFSKHALERMEERDISRRLIYQAIKNPTRHEASSKHKGQYLIKYKYSRSTDEEIKLRLLLIIYKETKEGIFIITVIDTSKINKYI